MRGVHHQELLDRVPPEVPAALVIETAAIARNYKRFAGQAPTSEAGAVVKADGYGLGTETVVKTLAGAGCRTFFVATVPEALKVRATAPEAAIYTLDGLPAKAAPLLSGSRLRPVLASLADVEEWAGEAQRRGKRLPAGLQIDSGMHRLGLGAGEVQRLSESRELLEHIHLSLILTQLMVADRAGDPRNAAQKQRFESLARLLPPAPLSIAAASGMMLEPTFHADLTRPGMGLYGGIPCPAAAHLVEPAAFLYARILQVHEAAAGEHVGYGAQRRFEAPVRLATLSIGYADGYGRALSDSGADDGAVCHIAGHAARVVGRISMDLTTIDVSAVPPELVTRGAFVAMMGDLTTVDTLATKAGTISYEILTRIGPRVARVPA